MQLLLLCVTVLKSAARLMSEHCHGQHAAGRASLVLPQQTRLMKVLISLLLQSGMPTLRNC